MSFKSERVKNWRKLSKQRIVDSMGGKCQICGYNRCQANLALHHIDPTNKDFGLGAIRASPKSWLKIVEELRKCVLLCHICHNELHEGIIELPQNYSKFNEEYANYKIDYKQNKKEIEQNNCPICNIKKSIYQKTCSNKCAGKLRYKIDWESVDLIELLKTKTIVKIAEELGCSDVAIHKRLKKLGLK